MFLCVPGKEVKGLQEMSVCECVMEMEGLWTDTRREEFAVYLKT